MKLGSRIRRIAAVLGLAGVVSTGLAAVAAQAGSETSVAEVGMASHAFWLGEADARADYAALAAGGVRWVREDFRWDILEPQKGSFDWRRTDSLMAAASQAGVNVLAILDYSATWASSDPSGAKSIYWPPKDNADYAAFARAVVLRYGPGGTFWSTRPDLTSPRPLMAVELWNEPWGHWFWKSGVDPVAYARLARAGAQAVKAASSQVQVLLPGDLLQVRTDGAIVGWLDNLLLADPGLMTYVDAYSVHPYPYPREQGPMVDHADRRWDYSRITLIRDVTVKRNAVRPLWITELGWSTAQTSDSVTEAKQAEFLADALTRAFNEWPYVERIFLYTSTKDRADLHDREAHYGLRRTDGSWKPAWAAVKSVIASYAQGTTSTTSAPSTTSTTSASTSTEPTAAPLTEITLKASVKKVGGVPNVTLQWSGVASADAKVVRGNKAEIMTENDGHHVDVLSKSTKGTIRYSVCDTAGACSASVAVRA